MVSWSQTKKEHRLKPGAKCSIKADSKEHRVEFGRTLKRVKSHETFKVELIFNLWQDCRLDYQPSPDSFLKYFGKKLSFKWLLKPLVSVGL